ncbi:MAG: hypothetical protein JXA21_11415 [Anaerolineae bacterium]|nr:hypothetical protein [Anaerolineae bacterium]
MSETARLEIGDAVVAENGHGGIIRYFTNDGKYAFVKDRWEFYKLPVEQLSQLQKANKTEEEHDGDGL